jgi:hypothetical protein
LCNGLASRPSSTSVRPGDRAAQHKPATNRVGQAGMTVAMAWLFFFWRIHPTVGLFRHPGPKRTKKNIRPCRLPGSLFVIIAERGFGDRSNGQPALNSSPMRSNRGEAGCTEDMLNKGVCDDEYDPAHFANRLLRRRHRVRLAQYRNVHPQAALEAAPHASRAQPASPCVTVRAPPAADLIRLQVKKVGGSAPLGHVEALRSLPPATGAPYTTLRSR